MAVVTMSVSVYDEAFTWYSENWNPSRPIGEWWALLAEAGWSFPAWPEGRGGRGLSPRAAKQAEQARLDAGAYGPPKGLSTFLVAPTLLTYATSEQLDRFMPGIVRGTDTWCQLFSEPGAGSDLASLSTRAVRDGDEWTITGQKVWNSGAQNAAFGILMARTDPSRPKHKGISFFLIDMTQEAVDVRPLREMTGDIAFNEVFLSDARVANDDLLGEQGEGWRIGMTTLSHERDPDNSGSGIGFDFAGADLNRTAGEHAAAVDGDVDGFGLAMSGGANRLLEDILNEFDVSADPVRRQRIRQLAELRLTSRWSTARSVAAVKAGGQPGPEVSTLKVIGAEVSRRTRDLGLEAMGPEGMLWGDDAPTGGQFHAYCMFTPAMSIAGGSDEVNRNIIGERVLGLPREPGESEQRQRPWSELPRN
ncbi:MAG: acyl-CoA dehydrogenase family protein [Ilumatobacter sp.]|jgi:alkylation response protein AidB-like acyl-CoA dehydrogenase|nr:acyl-CoA dehydrogenase family protein [Ilumatobacter sp.]MDG2438641.1 acyl-CoA dehydrogenase family protein [Ilumatobacter sp.]